MVVLPLQLGALDARRGCAPPQCAELLAGVGVPPRGIGRWMRPPVTGTTPWAAADLPQGAAELVAARFVSVAAAAEGCDAPVVTGVVQAGVRR